MPENKVVIKINYDKEKSRQPLAEPKMVTVWHTERIVAALSILLILIITPIYWLSSDDGQDSDEVKQIMAVDKAQALNNNDQEIKADGNMANRAAIVNQPLSRDAQTANRDKNIGSGGTRPTAIIFSRKVIRASLNRGARDSEPYEAVKLPIRLGQNQSTEVFYFTELRDHSPGNLYHVWSKNGRVVEKKQLNVKQGRGKVLSTRILSYKDKGEWQIQLVDGKGKVLSEFNFWVIPE